MNISVRELKERLTGKMDVNILDVREELEFYTFNIGGTNIPLTRLTISTEQLPTDKDEEIVVICQRGIRSATAQQLLIAQGYSNVRNLEGGLLALQRLEG